MKKMNFLRLTAFALIAALVLCAPLSVSAETTGTLTVEYPLNGTVFHLYRVGDMDGSGIRLDAAFANVDTADLAAAAGTIANMIELTGVGTELATATVADGKAVFSDLPMAVYLVTGESSVDNGINYWPTPFLVSMPQKDEGGDFVWDVTVSGKKEVDMDISVVKRWVGDVAANRPASVTVYLVLDGEDYGEAVELNEANNWSYMWEHLPPKNWYVREEYTPRYSTTIVKDGNTFVITNTWKRIPQTGQLWWPVSLLAVAGLSLLCIGMLRRRKSESDA